jgi:hypothetical protein
MHGWQVALILSAIGVFLILMAYFYLRPRAMRGKQVLSFSRWKLILFIGALMTIIGVIFLFLPESLWWS